MGTDERVVLRSSLRTLAAFAGVFLSVLAAELLWAHDVGSFLVAAFSFMAVATLMHHFRKVVLTSAGIEVWSLGYTLIPWAQISAVVTRGSWWTERYIGVLDLAGDRCRKLPAPRASFGLSGRDLERARDLIERWWLQHRGDPPVTPAPVPPDVLWAPPPSA
jgi:hypothetical protein